MTRLLHFLAEQPELSALLLSTLSGLLGWTGVTHARTLRFLKAIKAEFRSNGGSSMTDSLVRIENSVCAHEAGLRFICMMANFSCMEFDADGRCIWASPDICHTVGLAPHEMLDNGWLSCVNDQSERQRLASSWAAAIRDGVPYAEVFTTHNRERNEFARMELRVFPANSGKDNTPVKYYASLARIDRAPDTRLVGHSAYPAAAN